MLAQVFRRAGQRAQSLRGVARRYASDSAHSGAKSDAIWIAGSALVFIPTAVYISSPSDSHAAHVIEKAVPHQLRNFPISRPFSKEDEEEEPEPVEESEPEPAAPTEDNEMKTSRSTAPQGTTLEDMATHDDHEVTTRHVSAKSAATLQPDDTKLAFAANAATDEHHHDPKRGLAAHETEKESKNLPGSDK